MKKLTNKQKLLLAGAAGVVLLLLFRKKKPDYPVMYAAKGDIAPMTSTGETVTITTPNGQLYKKQGDVYIQMQP